MENKKYKSANLENKRGTFLQVGFIITLSLVLIAFEWTSSDLGIQGYKIVSPDDNLDSYIINTYRKKEEIRPPAPKITDEFIIRQDTADLEFLFQPPPQDITEESIVWESPEYIEPEDPGQGFFVVVEIMPQFRGGSLKSFWKYIQSEITYPEEARMLGMEGTVIVQFIVDDKGNVSQVTLIRSIDPYLDNEAIRVISSSPKWKPGIQAGKPVSVLFSIPVKFELRD
jgi:protein TonB